MNQSRFFATVSDSDSETSSSEEELIPTRPVGGAAFQFSDDEEDAKRVVRSSKEKRYEELTNLIKQIRNHKKIKDMSKMLTGFEDLTRAFTKARSVIDKQEAGVIPKFYLRCLVEMDDFIAECWEDREGRKNMSKNNSKSLATLRQKLRKYNKDFEQEISAYRENPEIDEEPDDDDAGSDSEDDDEPDYSVSSLKKASAPMESKSKFLKDQEESDEDDSEWDDSEDDETTSSSDEEKWADNPAARFLKKTTDIDAEKAPEKKKKEKKDKKESRRRDDDDGGEWKEVVDGARIAVKPKMFAKDAEINHAAVVKKLNEILAARGKKGTDRSEQIELLQELFNIAKAHDMGPAIYIKIMLAIISSIFDYNPNIATCMRTEMWVKCTEYVVSLLQSVTENPEIAIGELIPEDSESLAAPPYRIRGCVLTVVERMDEEFTKMLQGCDAHSPEYVERLKDEKTVCSIIERLQAYLENRGTSGEICRIYLRRIEHVYYKFDPEVFKSKEKDESKIGENSIQLMSRLCKYIYAKDNTDRIRTRAMLCHIYHHALHNNWYEARDLMLMSHLQDNIHHSDVPTQILYNRTMVQLGLCAFRHGNIKDAHNALLDIQSGGRAKELLAQGLLLQRQHERSSEQEKIEKRRQMPFHMHINLELLECVYLVSAMLLEIPYMAGRYDYIMPVIFNNLLDNNLSEKTFLLFGLAHEFDTRRRIISKSFNHQLKISDRQPLVGPPESMREHVVAAAKAMRNGNWENCRNFIINEKMNAKVWDLFHQADKVREMLCSKIQEETLRTYLFTYSSIYDSISMITLAEMFKLDKSVVHSIISKMIINEELMVSLDEPSETVVMHRTEPTRLQSLALQLADKLSSLVENNERTFEMKQGSFFTRGQQGYQRQGGYGRQQGYQQGRRQQQRQY